MDLRNSNRMNWISINRPDYEFFILTQNKHGLAISVDEYTNEHYPSLTSIPVPKSFKCLGNLVTPRCKHTSCKYFNYEDIIIGWDSYGFKDYLLTSTDEVMQWCLYYDRPRAPLYLAGRVVFVDYGWVYPLPELDNTQTVSLADIRKYVYGNVSGCEVQCIV